MKIIPLNCPNCSARLEIGENKEQLACGTCGSQLYVDRSGGTISLEFAKSLGAISTGAAQTAAELALVRLGKELNDAEWKVKHLEEDIEDETRKLTHYSFNEQDIMSQNEVALADERQKKFHESVKNFEAEIARVNSKGYGIILDIFLIISGIILIIGCILATWYFKSGLLLIPFGIVAFIIWFILIAIWGAGAIEERMKKNIKEAGDKIKDTNDKMNRYQMATEKRDVIEKAKAKSYQANEKLPEARALVARIEAEIAHNKKIVILKH